jgi:excisionase family DNA binding protein
MDTNAASGLVLPFPPELLEAVAERAAELVVEKLAASSGGSPYLDGAEQAARYLGWPLGRVQKLTAARIIPHHPVGRRVTYRKNELDAWLADLYEGPLRLRKAS